VSTEWSRGAAPQVVDESSWSLGVAVEGVRVAEAPGGADGAGPDPLAFEFVRFCYQRRSVAWPELYDEMCAVAARAEFRGMDYEQLERLGIRFVLAALPRLAEIAARVMAEERGRTPAIAAA
jgi:hypothetical protein